ncbi:MAG TPA: tetratricopeptide repeat protein [Actinomycetota bacterium]|nr:tetratricopeptide repeat protein [Actinomycetota bacterium]
MSQRTCDRCGTLLPDEARFCPRCGAWVADEEAGEERRMVTVLFADIAGSTRLAAGLDPERFREVLGAFYRMASDELSSLRGRAEKFVGDAVMAVFGLPYAHDDDALRAVRAGLSVRDRVERLGEELGLASPLRVRVGINTGRVVASTAPAGDFMVSGAAVNLAARLQQAADPGEVLVGTTTWLLTRDAAEFGDPRPLDAKGFAEAVQARPVLSLNPRSTRRTIPLVGRRRDLDLLRWTVERAAETRRAHLVTVLGEPGIGKSRLVQELVAGLPQETEVLVGRASEFGEDVTFAPLVDLVRRRLGVASDAPSSEVAHRLEDVVNGCCDPTDVDRVTAQLGLLLGLSQDGRDQRPYRAAEIRSGFLSFLEGLARTAPVVVVLEDLHLARPPLLDLVEEILRSGRRLPLAVVAVAREDLLRNRDGWGAGLADAMILRLEPLSLPESRELATAAAGKLDEPTAERIAVQAGGNPFFIVETTGMLLHEADEHRHGRAAPRTVAPPTVQAVVASRIDHLPDPARNLIRVASIFPGGAFHVDTLALVTDADPSLLDTLEAEELLVRDEGQPGRWRFRHELLREVAYDSLPKRERRRLHERVAEGIDAKEPSDKHAQHKAYHLEQAALAARDLDPTDAEPARRAAAALSRAGDLARWRMESRAAIDLYERALALADGDGGRAWPLAGIGEARYWLGEYAAAEASLAAALDVADQAADPADTRALAGRFLGDIALNIHGQPDRAERLFAEAEAAARQGGNLWSLSRTLLMSGWVPYWRGDFDAARQRFEQALEIARSNPEVDRWGEARALISLAGIASSLGHPREVLDIADQALALGREIGDPFTIATAEERRSNSYRAMWRLDEALACSMEAVRIYRDLGARWELASAAGDRGMLYRLQGKLADAEVDLREALALCRELGDRVLIAFTVAELAIILALDGRTDEARTVLEEATLPGPLDEPGDRTTILWARIIIALAEGDEDQARTHALEVLSIDRERGREMEVAIGTWWVAALFGAEAAGGDDEVEAARRRLEEAGYVRAFREPESLRGALTAVR